MLHMKLLALDMQRCVAFGGTVTAALHGVPTAHCVSGVLVCATQFIGERYYRSTSIDRRIVAPVGAVDGAPLATILPPPVKGC